MTPKRLTARRVLEWLTLPGYEWCRDVCAWCGNSEEDSHAAECPWRAARRLLARKPVSK